MEGRPLEEPELIERAKNGDVHAYEGLVRRYQDLAYRAAYLVCGNAADAEDAAQEAFIKAYGALHRFRRDASFRPWLLAIVSNEARNRVRSASRRASLALRLSHDRASGDAAPSPEAAALTRADAEALLDALARLPRRDQDVIACRYLLELSEAETAAALSLRKGTVKSRLSRALDKLRVALPEETR